jgi:hypothetical protein
MPALLCVWALPARAQVTLLPGAAGNVSFGTEAITGQSAGGSGPTFGSVDGYTNSLISAGHGLATLGTPDVVSTASGSITNQSLSASASGPSPFGSGQITFSAGNTGMGYGVLFSSYSTSGASGAAGLVSATLANGTASFINTGANPLDIDTGVFFGIQGTVGSHSTGGGALATTFTVDGSSYTPYVSMGFDGASSTGYVDAGFIGSAASGAVQMTSFQQTGKTDEGEGIIVYNTLLEPGQTLDIDTTFTLYGSGFCPFIPSDPIGWMTPPPVPRPGGGYLQAVSISTASATSCYSPPEEEPEPGATALGAAAGVLLAGLLFRKRARTALRRAYPVRRPL